MCRYQDFSLFDMAALHKLVFPKFKKKLVASRVCKGLCTLLYQISLKSIKQMQRYHIHLFTNWQQSSHHLRFWKIWIVKQPLVQILSKSAKQLQKYCNFSIFNMTASTILDFLHLKFLRASTVGRSNVHHCTKVYQNWSLLPRYSNLSFFQYGGRMLLPTYINKLLGIRSRHLTTNRLLCYLPVCM